MSGKTTDPLPKNATEAQGLLIKAFHEKCADEILPVIDNILGRQGRALGLKVKSKLPDCHLSTVAAAFTKNFDPTTIKIVSYPMKSSIFREQHALSDWKTHRGNSAKRLWRLIANIFLRQRMARLPCRL